MRYVSTRGKARPLGFEDTLLAGLAEDGGLYLPETWPSLGAGGVGALAALPYHEVVLRVIAPFVGEEVDPATLARMAREAYAAFDHPDVAPLRELGNGEYLLELFHGPTLSFKDYALQVVGRLFDHALARRGERVTVVGATSGDTGSAAIESLRDRKAVDVFILHPKGRVSEVQRRQMTTVAAPNIHNIAIEGHFDDCQDLVKAMFADAAFRGEMRLSAVNSINWARVMCQAAFYVSAAARLGGRLAFAVPTGNFGNVFAGWVARRMGAPIEQLIIGSNRNDILTRFVDTGVMQMHDVLPTLSPAMDIQVSSNFERLLFELWDRDAGRVAAAMEQFRRSGEYAVEAKVLREMRALFSACALDDDGTKRVIREVYQATGALIDPHTAVGLHAGRKERRDTSIPLVAISTAHPAKFPEAVEEATGRRPALPSALADLFDRPERLAVLPNDLSQVQRFIRERLAARSAA
jgi:threonine synthase